MNSLRIRVVRFADQYGADPARAFAVQVSQCGLVWWTLDTYGDEETAQAHGAELEGRIRKNFILRPAATLWTTQI